MRRRAKLVVIVGALLVLLAALVLAGPALTCAWLAWRCPWQVDEAFSVAGCARAGGPAAPSITVRASPAAVHAALAASGVSLPSWCFAAGQRAWGALAGSPWVLRVEDDVSIPTLDGRLAPTAATALLAAYLGEHPEWGLRVDRLDLRLEPAEDGALRLDLRAAGALRSSALVRLGVPAEAWVPVDALVAGGVLRCDGNVLRPEFTVHQATIAYGAMRLEVASWVRPALRRWLEAQRDGWCLPSAWPWPMRARVTVE